MLMIVQPDRQGVVGEVGADRDETERGVVETVVCCAKVHVEVF
jgi:hypothetical protein